MSTGNPKPPKMTRNDNVIKKKLCPDMIILLPSEPGMVENPALQKADMEWKAEKPSSCFKVIPREPCISSHIASIPMLSKVKVKPNIYNNVVNKELRDSEEVISRIAN